MARVRTRSCVKSSRGVAPARRASSTTPMQRDDPNSPVTPSRATPSCADAFGQDRPRPSWENAQESPAVPVEARSGRTISSAERSLQSRRSQTPMIQSAHSRHGFPRAAAGGRSPGGGGPGSQGGGRRCSGRLWKRLGSVSGSARRAEPMLRRVSRACENPQVFRLDRVCLTQPCTTPRPPGLTRRFQDDEVVHGWGGGKARAVCGSGSSLWFLVSAG